jgi:acyl-CoA reductase-like NAD-dependent aldehyde dehydrogenase
MNHHPKFNVLGGKVTLGGDVIPAVEKSLSLDVSHPDQVSRILRAAADAYYKSGAELTSAWQDDKAGKPWYQIAGILERAADQCEKLVGYCQDK